MSRIAVIIRACALQIAIAGGLCATPAFAQNAGPGAQPAPKPDAPATYSGCVQKAPGAGNDLVISTPTACARLSGKVTAEDLAGHQVELKGVLTPRTASAAASIQVDSVVSVGKSCSDVCSLRPPGTRGLHPPQGDAIPGSEGGTPGVAAPPK